MSKEYLLIMLKTLCDYNKVQIEHQFGTNYQSQITVRCVKHTQTIEINYLDSQTIKLFDSFEDAVEAIQQVQQVQQVINTDTTP